MRNKLAFTITLLFLDAYPDTVPTFLHPFLALLTIPDPSPSRPQDFHPQLLAVRLLSEIAQEVHDTTMRSARSWSGTRQMRDGTIRDVIRSIGDERLVVESILGLSEKGLDVLEGSRNVMKHKWLELVDLALKTLATWTRRLPSHPSSGSDELKPGSSSLFPSQRRR